MQMGAGVYSLNRGSLNRVSGVCSLVLEIVLKYSYHNLLKYLLRLTFCLAISLSAQSSQKNLHKCKDRYLFSLTKQLSLSLSTKTADHYLYVKIKMYIF